MSMRGENEGRGRGKPRGSKNKPGKKPYQYTIYTPGPEVYEELFRLHKEPPVITRTLPKQCPVPNAQSSILSRRQIQGFTRYYYNVRIVYDRDEVTDECETAEPREEVAQIEMSQILKYVSRYELERFEQEEYAQQIQAEEIARRAEAEEVARRRLEQNARKPGMGKGSRVLSGLGLDTTEVQVRTRRRLKGRGRGRGRGRGWGLGRGGLAVVNQSANHEELQQGFEEQAMPESAIMDTSEDEEAEDGGLDLLSNQPSPKFALSAFVANSALPRSPVAVHRRLSKTLLPQRDPLADEELNSADDEDDEQDTWSVSSVAAQLQSERDVCGQPLVGTVEKGDDSSEGMNDADRHRMKRRRTERPLSTPAKTHSISSWAKQLNSHARTLTDTHLAETPEPNSSDNAGEHLSLAQRRASRRRTVIEDTPDFVLPNNHDQDNEGLGQDKGEEEYVVEAILSHLYENGKKYYLVKWEGYEDSSDWLPEEDLAGALEIVTEYNERIAMEKGKEAVQ